MSRNSNPKTITNPASLVLVGEISHTLRAVGNALATGLQVNEGDDSPVVSGQYLEIPQPQVGILDYSSFAAAAGKFRDNGSVSSGVGDRTPWNLLGAVSLDAIFCPYTNFSESGRAGPYMPYWTKPSGLKTGNSKTLNPFDPFNQLEYLSVYNDVWTSGGHNLAMALSYNPLDSGGGGGLSGYVGISGTYPGGTGSPVDLYFEKDHWARRVVETTGIRSVGFKAPMVLTGWGYDVDSKPVPAHTGIGKSDRFHPEASWNTHLWKSGPVDLRWDEDRGVWTGNKNRVYLVKLTNLFTPPGFSFEVDRSNSRDQYTRNAPTVPSGYAPSSALYDPEYVAYQANSENKAFFEQLDYKGIDTNIYPYYEAFIIRETDDSTACSNNFYNIWTQDCQDCGHITNRCGGGHDTNGEKKKILIENPLRQSFDVGDLAFTVFTGRNQRVNSGSYYGGSGTGASGRIVTNASGVASFQVLSGGTGYTKGGFGIVSSGCKICMNLALQFDGGSLSTGIMIPASGFPANQFCNVTVYPNDAEVGTELLPIHWVIQSEFKSQQIVTHVECDNGILQTCTMKIQTQGYKTCEWCGEDTAFINN